MLSFGLLLSLGYIWFTAELWSCVFE